MIAAVALSALLAGLSPGPGSLPSAPGAVQLVQDAPAAVPEVAPQAAPARTARRRPARRTPRRRPAPAPQEEVLTIPAPAPAPAAPQADIAPMPNRNLEAPRAPAQPEVARIRPDLIQPRQLPDTRTQAGIDNLPDRQDRLYREPAAGARLNIPFSY